MAGGPAGLARWRVAVLAVAAVAVLVLAGVALLRPAAGRTGDAGRGAGQSGASGSGTGQPAASSPESSAALPAAVKRIAYVPYWDQQRAFASLRENLDVFDEVSPFWYALDPDGRIVLADKENTTVDRATVRFLQRRGIRVLPTVTNLRNGDFAPELVQRMLHDRTAVRTHVRALVALATGGGYDGIDLDYESLEAADREAYSGFLRELSGALHAKGKLLTTSVHPKVSDAGYDERNQAQDFRAIGAATDEVRVMTYDYHWETSPPGAIAPAAWVEQVIAWTVTQIPPEKVILGAVLLGYDWVGEQGTTVDNEMATSLAAAHHATIRRAGDRSPWFSYTDSGRRHTVWWEDAESVAVKLRLVREYGLGGVFFWRLGGEDPAVWPLIRG
jgi:spore germination protein